MILDKGLKCYWNFLTVVSFRILTALPCLVTVSVACFVCLRSLQYLSKKKKKRTPPPEAPPIPFLALFELFQYSFVSSEHFQIRQAIILFVTLETSPAPCDVCVDSIWSGATVPILPSDMALFSRTFVTCNTNKWQQQWCIVSFWISSCFSYLNMSSFFSVTSVVCDTGHNTVYIPTQRKISILEEIWDQ